MNPGFPLMLKIENLQGHGKSIIARISLPVGAGEIYAFIGPSGAGNSAYGSEFNKQADAA